MPSKLPNTYYPGCHYAWRSLNSVPKKEVSQTDSSDTRSIEGSLEDGKSLGEPLSNSNSLEYSDFDEENQKLTNQENQKSKKSEWYYDEILKVLFEADQPDEIGHTIKQLSPENEGADGFVLLKGNSEAEKPDISDNKIPVDKIPVDQFIKYIDEQLEAFLEAFKDPAALSKTSGFKWNMSHITEAFGTITRAIAIVLKNTPLERFQEEHLHQLEKLGDKILEICKNQYNVKSISEKDFYLLSQWHDQEHDSYFHSKIAQFLRDPSLKVVGFSLAEKLSDNAKIERAQDLYFGLGNIKQTLDQSSADLGTLGVWIEDQISLYRQILSDSPSDSHKYDTWYASCRSGFEEQSLSQQEYIQEKITDRLWRPVYTMPLSGQDAKILYALTEIQYFFGISSTEKQFMENLKNFITKTYEQFQEKIKPVLRNSSSSSSSSSSNSSKIRDDLLDTLLGIRSTLSAFQLLKGEWQEFLLNQIPSSQETLKDLQKSLEPLRNLLTLPLEDENSQHKTSLLGPITEYKNTLKSKYFDGNDAVLIPESEDFQEYELKNLITQLIDITKDVDDILFVADIRPVVDEDEKDLKAQELERITAPLIKELEDLEESIHSAPPNNVIKNMYQQVERAISAIEIGTNIRAYRDNLHFLGLPLVCIPNDVSEDTLRSIREEVAQNPESVSLYRSILLKDKIEILLKDRFFSKISEDSSKTGFPNLFKSLLDFLPKEPGFVQEQIVLNTLYKSVEDKQAILERVRKISFNLQKEKWESPGDGNTEGYLESIVTYYTTYATYQPKDPRTKRTLTDKDKEIISQINGFSTQKLQGRLKDIKEVIRELKVYEKAEALKNLENSLIQYEKAFGNLKNNKTEIFDWRWFGNSWNDTDKNRPAKEDFLQNISVEHRALAGYFYDLTCQCEALKEQKLGAISDHIDKSQARLKSQYEAVCLYLGVDSSDPAAGFPEQSPKWPELFSNPLSTDSKAIRLGLEDFKALKREKQIRLLAHQFIRSEKPYLCDSGVFDALHFYNRLFKQMGPGEKDLKEFTSFQTTAKNMGMSPDNLEEILENLFWDRNKSQECLKNKNTFIQCFAPYLRLRVHTGYKKSHKMWAFPKSCEDLAYDPVCLESIDRKIQEFLKIAWEQSWDLKGVLTPQEQAQWVRQYQSLLNIRAHSLEAMGVAFENQPPFKPHYQSFADGADNIRKYFDNTRIVFGRVPQFALKDLRYWIRMKDRITDNLTTILQYLKFRLQCWRKYLRLKGPLRNSDLVSNLYIHRSQVLKFRSHKKQREEKEMEAPKDSPSSEFSPKI